MGREGARNVAAALGPRQVALAIDPRPAPQEGRDRDRPGSGELGREGCRRCMSPPEPAIAIAGHEGDHVDLRPGDPGDDELGGDDREVPAPSFLPRRDEGTCAAVVDERSSGRGEREPPAAALGTASNRPRAGRPAALAPRRRATDESQQARATQRCPRHGRRRRICAGGRRRGATSSDATARPVTRVSRIRAGLCVVHAGRSGAARGVAERDRIHHLVVLVRVVHGIDVDVEIDRERRQVPALARRRCRPEVPDPARRRTAPGAPDGGRVRRPGAGLRGKVARLERRAGAAVAVGGIRPEESIEVESRRRARVRNRAPLNAGRGGARGDDGRAPARRALVVRLRQRQREAAVRVLLDGRHGACAMDVEPQSLQRHPRIRVGLFSPSLARLLDHAAGEARAQRSKHDPEDRHDGDELDQRVAVIAAQAAAGVSSSRSQSARPPAHRQIPAPNLNLSADRAYRVGREITLRVTETDERLPM